MTVLVYMLSAVMGGAAGILLAGKLGQAYLGMGDPYLFISVAAVVIGGTSILGGADILSAPSAGRSVIWF